MKTKLSEAVARDAVVPAGASQLLIWDTEITRYGLRIYPSGRKVYIVRYRLPGDRTDRTYMLGTWPAVTIDDARKAARIALGKVAREIDPAAKHREVKRRAEAVLAHLLSPDGAYARSLEARQLVNRKTVLSTLNRGLASFLGRDVAQLTLADVSAVIEALEQRRLFGAALDLRKATRRFLKWCVGRELVTHNVLAGWRREGLTRAQRLASEAKGERSLTDDEIRRLWAVTQPDRNDTFGSLLRVALLTGMRRGECADLTRTMVKRDRIVLPATVTKGGREHQIAITPLLAKVLADQPAIPNAADLVFPSPGKRIRIRAWTPSIKRIRKASGISDLRAHDLRKSCRTIMSKCGVPDDVAGLAIGHSRKGLDAIYNEDRKWAERVGAFHKVATYVEALIADAEFASGGPALATAA